MSKGKDRIRESNLRYKQSLGQNFLYDEDLLAELTAAAGVTKDEDVLEIGPGCGSLTKHLCDAANRVLAVENVDLTVWYAERERVPVWAAQAVANLEAVSVLESGRFDGEEETVTRAEAAKMLLAAGDLMK